MPVGQSADKGLRQSEDQVLDRDRQPEGLASDADIQLDRAQEQAE